MNLYPHRSETFRARRQGTLLTTRTSPTQQGATFRFPLLFHEFVQLVPLFAPKALTELQLKERSIKRLQTPDDLLGTLVFLASSDSDFMTGQAIVVDGGSVFH